MVTRVQLDRIGSRIEQLANLINPNAGAITVAVFAGETPEFALQRHCELRPEHGGRRVKFDHRTNKRDEIHELSAIWAGATEHDFQEFRREIEQMWDDVHQAKAAGRDMVGVEFVTEFVGKPHDNGNNSLW